MAFIGMPGTTKNKLNNIQEDFDAARKARSVNHMCLVDGRILDTRFEVTRATLNLGLFDVEMELDSYVMKMVAPFSFDDVEIEFDLYDVETVAPFSFDEDIHNNIGANKCNTIGRSGGDVIKEEKKPSTGREDRKSSKPAGEARTR